MTDSLFYRFYVSVGNRVAEKDVDLIAEGWVKSAERWETFRSSEREHILERILSTFVTNNSDSGWYRV